MSGWWGGWKSLGVLALCAVAAGCSPAWRPPIFQKNGFNMQWIDKITVVTPFDGRIDKATEVNFDEQLADASVKKLTERGYPTTLSDRDNGLGSMTSEDLAEPDANWVRGLGPPDARWVMVVSLVDVTSSMVFFGSTGSAEVAGYLYDKKDGTVVWRDKGAAQIGQGGLIGMALKSAMDDEAISESLNRLFASFPERTKEHPYIPEPVDTVDASPPPSASSSPP